MVTYTPLLSYVISTKVKHAKSISFITIGIYLVKSSFKTLSILRNDNSLIKALIISASIFFFVEALDRFYEKDCFTVFNSCFKY